MNNDEEEDDSSEAEVTPKILINSNNSNSQNNQFSRMNSKQDSSKSYNENLKDYSWKPKYPNPPENPFKNGKLQGKEITGNFDLHHFHPREIIPLIDEYLRECLNH